MAQSKQYKVEVSERAKRNLAKIVTYIAIENPIYLVFLNVAHFLKASLCLTISITNLL